MKGQLKFHTNLQIRKKHDYSYPFNVQRDRDKGKVVLLTVYRQKIALRYPR